MLRLEWLGASTAAHHFAPRRANMRDVAIGAPNGVSARRPFDRWFRYPAGFSPSTLSTALDAVGLADGDVLVDPFAGSASAGSQVIARGATFLGIEAHPLIAELAQLKF